MVQKVIAVLDQNPGRPGPIQRMVFNDSWIPAFAGMTISRDYQFPRILNIQGMTQGNSVLNNRQLHLLQFSLLLTAETQRSQRSAEILAVTPRTLRLCGERNPQDATAPWE